MSIFGALGEVVGLLTLVTAAGLLIIFKRAGRSPENGRSLARADISSENPRSSLSSLLAPELAMLETQLNFLRDSFGNIESLCGLFQETLLAAKDGRLDKKLLDKADETARRLDMEYLKSEVPKALKESLQIIRRIQVLIT